MRGISPEQRLTFNLKNAWVASYGSDVALWPERLRDSLETINAGVGFANFEQNVTAALQNLRLDDMTYPAFEAGVAITRGLSPSPLGDTDLIPDSAARAGLSFISSPLTLIAPIWIGGMAGRAATAGVARAGGALALTKEALASLGTLIGLTAESAAFVGASDVLQRVAQDFSPAGIGRSKDLRYILEQTASATFFFGGLRVFGWAGQLAQRLLPATEVGIALAKLTGHTASVLGLASMEDVQDAAGIKGDRPPQKRGPSPFYESLWRALFLHATISGVRRIVSVEGVKSEAEDIRQRAEGLLELVGEGLCLPASGVVAGPLPDVRAAAPARRRVGGGEGRPYRIGRSKDLRYKLMMSGSDDRPPSERDSLLQYVPGYRGKVPPEARADLITKLDELEPTDAAPSIGVTLADGISYLFKGGVKVLSDAIDVLPDGEVVTVINNYPTTINIGRVTKLGQHVVSVEPVDKDGALGVKKITLFIKIRDKRKKGVSIFPLSFPAGNLNDLRGSNTTMLIQGVRIRPAFDGEGRLDRFEATVKLRPELELDVDKFVIPAGVLEDEMSKPEPIFEEPSNVIDITGRRGKAPADAAPPRGPGSVIKLWPKGIDNLKKGLKLLFGKESPPIAELVPAKAVTEEDILLLMGKRRNFTEAQMDGMMRLVTMIRKGTNSERASFTLAIIASHIERMGDVPEARLVEIESIFEETPGGFVRGTGCAGKLVRQIEIWLSSGRAGSAVLGLPFAEQALADIPRDEIKKLIVKHNYRGTLLIVDLSGRVVFSSIPQYPGVNPDGTVDMNSGLPLDKIFRGLFSVFRREDGAGLAPQAESKQDEVAAEIEPLPAVDIPSPALPFAELAKNPTIKPRLKLAFEMAEAREQGREDVWRENDLISVAVIGYRPLADQTRQDAAERNVALIDRFIAGTELDIVVVGGIEEQHISEMDRASKTGTVVAAFPKAERGVMLMREKLEAAGWRAGIGRLGGRLAIMAVKTDVVAKLALPNHVAQGFSPATIGRPEGLRYKSGEGQKGPMRPPTVKWDGRREDPALAPTVQALVAGGDQPTEMMIGGGPGGRMVEKIVKPFSPQLKGVLNGPVMEKLLRAIPDTDEAMIELAGHVYKIVFLQGISVGEEVTSRIDLVADIARRIGDVGKADMRFAPYEEGQLRLFAEVFDSIASAAADAGQRAYAMQLTSLLEGSGRDISNISQVVGRYTGKKYPFNDLIDSVK